MPALIDITGQNFGRLIVLGRCGRNKHGHVTWYCRCSCGKEKIITGNELKNGHTKSCGCLFLEGNHKKHGYKYSKIYATWQHMRQRCVNSNDDEYTNYGGRGIIVCERWMQFENFLADMGEPPTSKHSIDRIDNNGHYCPKNCRWATIAQQARNKRNNHRVTYRGTTKSVIEWSENVDIPYNTLIKRLYRGWSVEKTLTTPVNRRKT